MNKSQVMSQKIILLYRFFHKKQECVNDSYYQYDMDITSKKTTKQFSNTTSNTPQKTYNFLEQGSVSVLQNPGKTNLYSSGVTQSTSNIKAQIHNYET